MWVLNARRESHVYTLSEFSGAVRFDGPGFAASTKERNVGVTAGNDCPTIYHYQVRHGGRGHVGVFRKGSAPTPTPANTHTHTHTHTHTVPHCASQHD